MTIDTEAFFRELRLARERRDQFELPASLFIAGCLIGVAIALGAWLACGSP